MIAVILLSFVSALWSQVAPLEWRGVIELRERHEFYQDNEVILKPRGSWQVLFAIIYPDRSLELNKDCVFYKVPGDTPGVFKTKAIEIDEVCEGHMEDPGELEIGNLKALQFSFGDELNFHFTFTDFRSVNWSIPRSNRWTRPTPKLLTSSAQFKAPKVILLSPLKGDAKSRGSEKELKDGELCHAVSEDCQEISPSSCQRCPGGWYEVPNGCEVGPRYCGLQVCGLKNRPACRRGMKWQRVRKKFDCATDSSFAYCADGLSVQCEGGRAFCR